MPGTRDAPLRQADAAWMARLRRVLTDVGYTEQGLAGVRGSDEDDPGGRPNIAVYRRRLRDDVPLHTLVKLFILGLDVPAAAAAAAFAPLPLDEVAGTGLLEGDGKTVRAPVALTVLDQLLILHDHAAHGLADVAADHVVGLGPSALALLRLTPPRPGARVLDLGCGSGVQAFMAARSAAAVVGVDISPRALNLAAFGAALNDLGQIDWRAGSWLAPVAGETFDLIVSNPPYVVSPESRYQYRDGGLPGDQVCAALVRDAAAHLSDGGVAVVLANWGIRGGQEWWTTAAAWADDLGCDAWILRDDVVDPLSYAAIWNRGLTGARYEEALDAWTAHARAHGMEAIASGAVLLRRRAGAHNWLRTASPADFTHALGDHVDRVFAAEDLLALPDAGQRLLAAALRPAPDHLLEQTLVLGQDSPQVVGIRLRLPGGLRSAAEPDPRVLALVGAMDGHRPLKALVDELAERLGTTADAIARDAVEVVRRLLLLGLIEVSPDGA